MSVTFDVGSVKTEATPMPALDRAGAMETLLVKRIEQAYTSDRRLVAATDANALAQAAHDAFYRHFPLVLSPDSIWLCIAQGFANHIALNAEELRARFVRHEGKKKLVVERGDFELGRFNPWPEAFAAFSEQIAADVGKQRDLVVADFTTTGPLERAASEIVLMDAFQPYFEYEMMIGCGIPSMTLLGTVDDWKSVRTRAAMLSEFGLEHWTDVLLPVLDELVRTAEGKIDQAFWRSFFRYQSGSGPSELTGWILTLFPYLVHNEGTWRAPQKSLRPNTYLANWKRAYERAESRTNWRIDRVEGPVLLAIPPSISSAPVKVTHALTEAVTMLRFVGGMFGVVQDESTRALAPEFGWAVVYDE